MMLLNVINSSATRLFISANSKKMCFCKRNCVLHFFFLYCEQSRENTTDFIVHSIPVYIQQFAPFYSASNYSASTVRPQRKMKVTVIPGDG
ncbi:unnamed protein product, partial [Brugia pahangi]|uniref:Iso_dh domain-containing protein n=1 Tax=Brugia pahangi TaxID=6280 RepID=A0A0N4THM1_BRUPA